MSHQHEALDRTHVVIETVAAHILNHPFTDKHEDVKQQAGKALEALCHLYQLIGRKDEQ